jgi:hypothetical protein
MDKSIFVQKRKSYFTATFCEKGITEYSFVTDLRYKF